MGALPVSQTVVRQQQHPKVWPETSGRATREFLDFPSLCPRNNNEGGGGVCPVGCCFTNVEDTQWPARLSHCVSPSLTTISFRRHFLQTLDGNSLGSYIVGVCVCLYGCIVSLHPVLFPPIPTAVAAPSIESVEAQRSACMGRGGQIHDAHN